MKQKFILLAVAAVLTGCLLNGCSTKTGKNNTSTNVTTNESTNENTNTGKDIGEKKAQEIAIADAGVKQADLSRLKVRKEQDDSRVIYDVEFIDQANGMEYDYEILASDGSVYSFEKEKFNHAANAENMNNVQVKIKKEEAIKKVLDKVPGASEKDLYIQLEEDHGIYVYDGEVVNEKREFDFEIDANTGEFIKWAEKVNHTKETIKK